MIIFNTQLFMLFARISCWFTSFLRHKHTHFLYQYSMWLKLMPSSAFSGVIRERWQKLFFISSIAYTEQRSHLILSQLLNVQHLNIWRDFRTHLLNMFFRFLSSAHAYTIFKQLCRGIKRSVFMLISRKEFPRKQLCCGLGWSDISYHKLVEGRRECARVEEIFEE